MTTALIPLRKVWDIPGGVHPAENKAQSTHCPIASIPLPAQVVLPLNQHLGAPALPLVAVGEYVRTGQKIAEAQGLVSVPMHASLSGTVVAIEERPIPHASGLGAPCIVIDSDGEDRWVDCPRDDDYLSRDKLVLVQRLREAGLAGMGGAGFPTAVKMRPRADQPVDTLILNGTECEPYITADDMLMRERAEEVVAGAELLAKVLGTVKQILIGVEDNKPEAIASLRAAAKAVPAIEVVSFPTKYPSGGEKQLIQILTGKEVPSGGIPAQIGIVVQNVGTAVAAYRAARFGEPLISRVTTVVGQALGLQRNIDVRLGTPIAHVLKHHGFRQSDCARLIIGGPMMGFAMTRFDIPVIKTTNCILVPSHAEMPAQPEAQPCIRCGLCAEACPASLLPQQLLWYAQSEDVDKLHSHHLFDCIECGACSYVCPSNIPLVQHYRAAKGTLRKLEQDKQKSDRSRERFEARQARIAKEEAEKEAKRMARKEAAEAVKQQLAGQGKAPTHPIGQTLAAPPQTNSADPQERAKLERALSSAESRAQRAREQLENERAGGEADAQRLETLAARLKQAELKVQEAQARLDAPTSAGSTPVAAKIADKLAQSPRDKAAQNLATLQKRLATAEEKFAEAQASGAATADALGQGVEKLRAKLAEAERECAALDDADGAVAPPLDGASREAAAEAIAKAQAKAAALAGMSDEDKARAQREALQQRLDKARERLAQAEAEGSEHVEALRGGVEKLEAKLRDSVS